MHGFILGIESYEWSNSDPGCNPLKRSTDSLYFIIDRKPAGCHSCLTDNFDSQPSLSPVFVSGLSPTPAFGPAARGVDHARCPLSATRCLICIHTARPGRNRTFLLRRARCRRNEIWALCHSWSIVTGPGTWSVARKQKL